MKTPIPLCGQDLETHINKMVPENMAYYLHNYEGADDMPAHIKASLIGNNLTIPIVGGSLGLRAMARNNTRGTSSTSYKSSLNCDYLRRMNV